MGVLNAHLFDFARTARELRRREVTPHDREELTAWFDARAAEVAAEEPSGFGIARGKNLILIQVESAQTFVIGAEVGGQEITPFMNRLRERGLYYPELVDQTAQGKTSDGEYAVLSSQHPLRSGALCFLRADNHFVTLAHVLAAQGYSTFSAHPFKRGFWNRAVLHPRYGFERSMFRRELGPGPEIGWGLADGPFLERVVEELREQSEPFFAFLITLSLHHPYDEFPARFAVLDLGELEGTRLGNWLHGMNYFDRALEDMFRRLEEEGMLEDTMVALYGDHDARLDLEPELLELAGVARWSPSVSHRLERVPFFVVLPGGEPHGVVDRVGGQIDVAPTLLHYLGVPRPRAFMGRALTPDVAEGFAAYPDGSAFTDDRFFVRAGYDIPSGGACFDAREGTARPREDCDELASRSREELARSRAVLDLDLHRALAEPPLVQDIESSQTD
jgi:phosphoglycerol transferase MdoB-like AlkP superfamily enzyme